MRHGLDGFIQRRARNGGQAITVGQVLAQQQAVFIANVSALRVRPRPRPVALHGIGHLVVRHHTPQRVIFFKRSDYQLARNRPPGLFGVPKPGQPPRHLVPTTQHPLAALFRAACGNGLLGCIQFLRLCSRQQGFGARKKIQHVIGRPPIIHNGIFAVPPAGLFAGLWYGQQAHRAAVRIAQQGANAQHGPHARLFGLWQQRFTGSQSLHGCGIVSHLLPFRAAQRLWLRIAIGPQHHRCATQQRPIGLLPRIASARPAHHTVHARVMGIEQGLQHLGLNLSLHQHHGAACWPCVAGHKQRARLVPLPPSPSSAAISVALAVSVRQRFLAAIRRSEAHNVTVQVFANPVFCFVHNGFVWPVVMPKHRPRRASRHW